MLKPAFVKKFDIRGKYGVEIHDIDAFYVSLALIKTFKPKNILIGWDTRPISYALACNALAAFIKEGVLVSILPSCPIEYVTVGANGGNYDLSIMITGSHNTYDWTGLLIHLPGGDSLRDEKMDQVFECYESCLKIEPSVPFTQLDMLDNAIPQIEGLYVHKLLQLIPMKEIPTMEIVVDIGDGSGYRCLDIFESLLPQVTVHRLNDRRIYDKDSSHIADPSLPESMQQVQDLMQKNSSIAYGFAFDSDADRVLGIDASGKYENGAQMGAVIGQVEALLHHFRPFRIGYAVECGPAVKNTFLQLRNKSIKLSPIPVGRSIHRGLLREGLQDFCVENVGHFYYNEFFQTDSSIYSMMLLLLSHAKQFKNRILSLPDGFRSEMSIPATKDFTQINEDLRLELEELFQHMSIFSVDGVRGEIMDDKGFLHSWFAIRHSGYEDKYKCYFGSLNAANFYTLKKIFSQFLSV